MDSGINFLFNKTLADMHHVGALGGRARARNLRLRKATEVPVISAGNQQLHEEPVSEAIRRIDALCPWLVGAEHRGARLRTS
jgi:hypothetical protein